MSDLTVAMGLEDSDRGMRRRACLLSFALDEGGDLQESLELAARADLWLSGSLSSEEVAGLTRTIQEKLLTELSDALPDWQKSPKLRDMLQAVSTVSQVPIPLLRSNRRTVAIALPRQVFFWLAAQYSSASLPEIGRFVDRDHTTVLHGRNAIDKRLEERSCATIDLIVAAAKLLGYRLPAHLIEAEGLAQVPEPEAPAEPDPSPEAPAPEVMPPAASPMDEPKPEAPRGPSAAQLAARRSGGGCGRRLTSPPARSVDRIDPRQPAPRRQVSSQTEVDRLIAEGKVAVKRYEPGDFASLLRRTLMDAGHEVAVLGEGSWGVKSVKIDGREVPLPKALQRANAIRAERGLAPLGAPS